MKFHEDTELGFWTANATLNGFSIQIRLETDDENSTEAATTGNRVMKHVNQNWAVVAESLVKQLLATHNDIWADPAHERATLKETEFLASLIPISIDYGTWDEDGATKELLSILFDDSNLFGGHVVDVCWDPSRIPISPSARIAG